MNCAFFLFRLDNFKIALVPAAALALAFTMADSEAHASSVGGWAGRPNDPTQLSCFRRDTSLPNTVVNLNCGTAVWDVPLMLTSGGSHTVTVYGSAMNCLLYGLGQNGVVQSVQAGSGSGGTFTLTATATGPGTSALLRCSLPTNGSISSVNYNS